MSAVRHKKGRNRDKSKKLVHETRKEIRKKKRLQKKQNRKMFYENLREKNQNKKPVELVSQNSSQEERKTQKGVNVIKKVKKDKLKKELEEEKRELQKLEKDMAEARQIQLMKANNNEDKTIHHLEKKLKLHKKKSKTIPKQFVDDGLDYLLDFCDEEKRKIAVEAEKQLLEADSESEFENDFVVVTGRFSEKRVKKKKLSDNSSDFLNEGSLKKLSQLNKDKIQDFVESDDKQNFSYEEENDNEEDYSNESFEHGNEQDFSNENSDGNPGDEMECEKWSMEKDDSNSDRRVFAESDEIADERRKKRKSRDDKIVRQCEENQENYFNSEESENHWEDIYGRVRDKDGKIVTKRQAPPTVIAKTLDQDSKNSERLSKLRRQLKGPLNRLTDRNMHSISEQIDGLFLTNSRNDMNNLLTELIMEALVKPVMTPERLIMEHMMLIAILHGNVDSEVGAQFLQTIVKRLDETLKSQQEIENKELDNLVLMLAHLYNFKVSSSGLIYEVLEKLVEKFTEKEIELILLILKSLGFSLRKDDPVALKELILKLQQKASAKTGDNGRVKFMLEILLAIKNNNITKIPNYDPSVLDGLKKHLKVLIRKGARISQLNITLDDLLQADKRGKWWIVGAAWTGSTTLSKKEKMNENKLQFSEKLLELARKQRMNTELRRNIFCIIMSAEDYLDAFEKLLHLGLKGGQEKEIIYVLMSCSLQEKNFNPYYAILAQKLCEYDRKFQMTIQYNLWDKLKILQTLNNRQLMNLAHFLTYLFIHKGLSISSLKVIQLEELDKSKMKLLRQIILGIIMHDDLETCLTVFERVTRSEKLKNFREALRLFILHFIVKNAKEGLIPDDKAQLIKRRAELVDRLLITQSSKIIF